MVGALEPHPRTGRTGSGGLRLRGLEQNVLLTTRNIGTRARSLPSMPPVEAEGRSPAELHSRPGMLCQQLLLRVEEEEEAWGVEPRQFY